MRVTRQTAQFLTLIWMAGSPQYFRAEAIYGFLASLCKTLDWGSQPRRTLKDAVVGLLSIVEKRRQDQIFQPVDWCYEVQSVWKLTSGADPADLLLACEFILPLIIPSQSRTSRAASLAAYVCATAGSRSSHLVRADAWSYFCDVLLLILGKEFVESELEPLSLFAAPGICRALLSLLESETATGHPRTSSLMQFENGDADWQQVRHFLSSPWTICLMTQLRKLQLLADSTSGGEDYATILSRRISLLAELLYNHVRGSSQSSA